MVALFKDNQKQKEFDRNGYTTLSLFTDGEVSELLEFYHSVDHGEISDYFYCTLNTDREAGFIQGIHRRLCEISRTPLEKHFADFQFVLNNYLVKKPNPQNRILPHQDWSVVDESKFDCINVWVPLIDVTVENGTLGVLKGSQKLFPETRFSPSDYCKPPFADYMEQVFCHMEFPPVKAGHALVFNTATVHASMPNASDQLRIATVYGITHKSAPWYHYYKLPDKDGETCFGIYEIDDSFFGTFNDTFLKKLYDQGSQPANLPYVGEGSNKQQNLTESQLVSLMRDAGNQYTPEFIDKLR